MINVAVTDDHPSIICGLQNMFRGNKEFVISYTFANGESTLRELPQTNTQVLILDINLQDISGIDVCRQLKIKMPEIKIIAFTSFKDTRYLKTLINSGASGYLLKNSSYEEILDAIATVHDGKEYIQTEMKEELFKESLNRKTSVNFIPKLTRREKEILDLILDEFTTQQIADKLFINFKTVETHRFNLLQKLGAKNTAGLVRIAIEQGLV